MAKKKLLLLTAEQENWAPREIVRAAEEAGFEIEVINPELCYINISGEPYISYEGTKFLGADYCIPRLSEDHLEYKVALMNHVAKMDIKILNTGASMQTASNKIETQIKLNSEGLRTPNSSLFTGEEQLDFAIESVGGKFPIVVKTIRGTHGVGVIRADSQASLKSIVQQMLKMKVEFMLQEYIEHEESSRILMLGEKCLAAVIRTTPKNDFRTNAHQHAQLKRFKPSDKELKLVKKAADTIGINFCAVDYILKDDDIIFLEVNGSPGFEVMQKVVEDISIAAELIKFCSTELGTSEEEEKDFRMGDEEEDDQPINVNVNGNDDKIEIEVQDISKTMKPTGPPEEEEEEEEVKKHHEKTVDVEKEKNKKVVDVDKEVKKDDDDEKEDKAIKKNDDGEVEVHPHHNVVSPELLDKSHEQIVGTVTTVKISHFNDGDQIQARVDTGANTSSIGGEDIKIDKEANKVSFRFNGTIYKFHLLRVAKIKQADSKKTTVRPVIRVDMEINDIKLRNIELNVNTRLNMQYPVLLGRSTLAQAGLLVNPAVSFVPLTQAVISTSEEEE